MREAELLVFDDLSSALDELLATSAEMHQLRHNDQHAVEASNARVARKSGLP